MSHTRDWRLSQMSQAMETPQAEEQGVQTEDGSQANGERVIMEQREPKPKPPSDKRQRPPKPKPAPQTKKPPSKPDKDKSG